MLFSYKGVMPATSLRRLLRGVATFAIGILWGRVLNRPIPQGPLFLTWHLTFDCNAFCSFCSTHKVHKRHPPEMALDRALALADEIAASGTWVVGFTGGEVLLSPLLFPLIRRLKSHGLTCYIVTNGMLLERHAQDVVDSGVDYVVVSIDSDDPAEHDRNRHLDGLFEAAMRGIDAVKARRRGSRPQLKTTTVITSWNLERVVPILEMLSEKVDKVAAQPVTWGYQDHPHGKSKEQLEQHIFAPDQRARVEAGFARISERFPMFRNRYFGSIPTYWFDPHSLMQSTPCWSPFLRLSIMPDGDVVHCAARFPPVGNVLRDGIKAVWNSPAMLQQRDLVRRRRNRCICWSQDSSFNALMSGLPLVNRLPALGRDLGDDVAALSSSKDQSAS
ncbi:radical SAM protein [Magnetospirillum aberrantis]|uniref:Radical SAM protein n=1 Tax=Magnetospirillum aberrantis SpK TaxID=908842 RepID=A0A7C9QVH8_9PROT|nr:radical SAM protein [Magnetospirillum aberrantis SpK]